MTPSTGHRNTATSTTKGPGARTRPGPEQPEPGTQAATARTTTIRLPFITAQFETAGRPAGDGWRLGPLSMPSPGKTAYYLGLGALAVAQVVEWPVAAAIAAGTYAAQHTRGEATARPQPASSAAGDERSGV